MQGPASPVPPVLPTQAPTVELFSGPDHALEIGLGTTGGVLLLAVAVYGIYSLAAPFFGWAVCITSFFMNISYHNALCIVIFHYQNNL